MCWTRNLQEAGCWESVGVRKARLAAALVGPVVAGAINEESEVMATSDE